MSGCKKAPSEIILAFSNLNSHLDDAPSVHGGNRFQYNIRRVDNYSCIHVLWDHGMIAYALYMANEGGVTILLIPGRFLDESISWDWPMPSHDQVLTCRYKYIHYLAVCFAL